MFATTSLGEMAPIYTMKPWALAGQGEMGREIFRFSLLLFNTACAQHAHTHTHLSLIIAPALILVQFRPIDYPQTIFWLSPNLIQVQPQTYFSLILTRSGLDPNIFLLTSKKGQGYEFPKLVYLNNFQCL